MQDLHEGWGANLELELKDRNLTPQGLAEACGVHRSTVSRILSGRLNPNDELKYKIAGVLGVRMDVLWAWPRIVPPHPQRQAA